MIERKQQYLETLGVNDRLMMLLQDMAKEKKMSEVEQQNQRNCQRKELIKDKKITIFVKR